MSPNQLLFSHRYAEAVEAYKLEMSRQPDKNLRAPMGEAFLAMRDFGKALECFRRDNEIESNRVKGHFPSSDQIGTALWLLGEYLEAIKQWHRAVAGILDRTVRYADASGGGSHGLLLFYGAITRKDETERAYALNFLREISAGKTSVVNWPRPIILMVLGDISFTEVLEIGIGTPVISEGLEQAAVDLLKRRRLCQSLFYAACEHRRDGNEAECVKMMRLCSDLENPIIESEWYLARDEPH